MTRVGLLSDTHGYLFPRILTLFKDCDEIWHAGDIGNLNVIKQLSSGHNVRAVYGNIDGQDVRASFPEVQSFRCEKVNVLMMHIGGYPDRYEKKAVSLIKKEKPSLFISGHSHILKVMYDPKFELLHINPGAAGIFGLHKIPTLIRFEINGQKIENLEVIEINRSEMKK